MTCDQPAVPGDGNLSRRQMSALDLESDTSAQNVQSKRIDTRVGGIDQLT
jgi:hypothetical protein